MKLWQNLLLVVPVFAGKKNKDANTTVDLDIRQGGCDGKKWNECNLPCQGEGKTHEFCKCIEGECFKCLAGNEFEAHDNNDPAAKTCKDIDECGRNVWNNPCDQLHPIGTKECQNTDPKIDGTKFICVDPAEPTCDEKCSKDCTDNPSENSDCKCLDKGFGPQCAVCHNGQKFSAPDSQSCVNPVEPTCDEKCNKNCIDNPSVYSDCKCLDKGWGPQCAECKNGQKFSHKDSQSCVNPTCIQPEIDFCQFPCDDDPALDGVCKCIRDDYNQSHNDLCYSCRPDEEFESENSKKCIKKVTTTPTVETTTAAVVLVDPCNSMDCSSQCQGESHKDYKCKCLTDENRKGHCKWCTAGTDFISEDSGDCKDIDECAINQWVDPCDHAPHDFPRGTKVCANRDAGYDCLNPDCLVFTTTLNAGNIKIEMTFNDGPDRIIHFDVKKGGEHKECFKPKSLASYKLTSDGPKWTGDITYEYGINLGHKLNHDLTTKVMTMECETNCGCECTGSGCDGNCHPMDKINLGISADSNGVDGSTRCEKKKTCSFGVVLADAPIDPTCSTADLDKCDTYCAEHANGFFGSCKCMNVKDSPVTCHLCIKGFTFPSEDSEKCERISYSQASDSCAFDCNKDCDANPGDHAVCKCIKTGWGDQCVSCPTGQNFMSEESATCVAIEEPTCDEKCNKDCIDNPTIYSACKCLDKGWGPQCATCRNGQVFSAPDSQSCVNPVVPTEEPTCDDKCNKDCIDNPSEYSDCKCLDKGWGPQCATCRNGQKFSAPDSQSCVNPVKPTCEERCSKLCTDSPDTHAQCECLTPADGQGDYEEDLYDRCFTCPPGSKIYNSVQAGPQCIAIPKPLCEVSRLPMDGAYWECDGPVNNKHTCTHVCATGPRSDQNSGATAVCLTVGKKADIWQIRKKGLMNCVPCNSTPLAKFPINGGGSWKCNSKPVSKCTIKCPAGNKVSGVVTCNRNKSPADVSDDWRTSFKNTDWTCDQPPMCNEDDIAGKMKKYLKKKFKDSTYSYSASNFNFKTPLFGQYLITASMICPTDENKVAKQIWLRCKLNKPKTRGVWQFKGDPDQHWSSVPCKPGPN